MDKVEDLKEMSQLWSENKDEEAYDKWEQGELEKNCAPTPEATPAATPGKGRERRRGRRDRRCGVEAASRSRGCFQHVCRGNYCADAGDNGRGKCIDSRAPSHTGSYSRLSRPCVGAPGHGRGPKKNEPVPIGCRIFGNGSRIPGVPEKGQ